ncbi:hypothetical protein AMR42_12550 [Limnothrix sp. PR1529]|nr:hypothetical protein BCR12_14750 [Limnothrix sp. P13C2]PIB09765.1 hypothetical protein AMR42_12550 [Limnothrix sp. PR1529]
MLTALPPEKPVAAEGDRPPIIGHVHELDFYLQAHEAKNRGYHSRAVCLLCLAARNFGLEWTSLGHVLLDWDYNLPNVDKAWAELWEDPNG